jgi:protein-S-isoprenylcysteine O-methyltransferase Ste14
MTPLQVQQFGALYLPLAAAMLLGLWRKASGTGSGGRRLFPGVLLSLLWTLPTLLIVQRLNQTAGWWTFPAPQGAFRGMPLALYAGWAILWGALPPLAFPRLAVPAQAAVMVMLDLILMPACPALVTLGPRWLVGESVAVLVVLAPALLLARWTQRNTCLPQRVALQVVLAAMLFLFLIPEITFALQPSPNVGLWSIYASGHSPRHAPIHPSGHESGGGWSPLFAMPGWQRQIALQLIFVLALPGLSAVQEFASRGRGTPIPYDPPQRLVTSGIYRYVANPMQLSCSLVMFAWAALLRNPWLGLAAAVSLLYSAGLAAWDEGQDLGARFGKSWRDYRAVVGNWLPRWRPYHAGPSARLYVDLSCGPCSEIRRWLTLRRPEGLEIADACLLPYGSIRRIRYDPGDGIDSEQGIRALGRALEHLHLGWALAGAALRLPGVRQVIQLVMDASGFGPRPAGQACTVSRGVRQTAGPVGR